MKRKSIRKQKINLAVLAPISCIAAAVGLMFSACQEDFLKPEPMSFFEPTQTFSTKSGLDAALAQCDRGMRYMLTNPGNTSTPLAAEFVFSEMLVQSKTDDANVFFDIANILSPINRGPLSEIDRHWDERWKVIKYANTVLSSIDKVEGLDEAVRNVYKGQAYFHRALQYYYLVFQFGDVPLISKMPEVAKFNYRSCEKGAILDMLVSDMEFAIANVPEQSELDLVGKVNKGACRMLIAKLYMATGKFTQAKAQLDQLIDGSGYSLMTGNFGTFNQGGEPKTWRITRNVIWDLHRPENKYIAANKEAILVGINRGTTSCIQTFHPRVMVPHLGEQCFAPSPNATTQGINHIARSNSAYNDTMDYCRAFGRGIGCYRLTSYATNGVWAVNGTMDNGDLRHSVSSGNWVTFKSLKYNNVPRTSTWYGKPWTMTDPANGTMLLQDSIRAYSPGWPHYKYYLFDNQTETNMTSNDFQGVRGGSGGDASWYVYRLAEAYLLRAECKYYLGEDGTSDVNAIRTRANCSQTYATVTIDDIMDERARELYFEEYRNVELCRVSRCLALSGKTGMSKTWTIDNYDKEDNYWYLRVNTYNNFYNKGSINARGRTFTYSIAPKNFYWPIPNPTIQANNKAKLWQNWGYDGYDPATPKWRTWQEAVDDEAKN